MQEVIKSLKDCLSTIIKKQKDIKIISTGLLIKNSILTQIKR